MMRAPILIAIVLLSSPTAAFAHERGGPGGPRDLEELWSAWAWEPGGVASLAASAGLYGWGLRRLWRSFPGDAPMIGRRVLASLAVACAGFGPPDATGASADTFFGLRSDGGDAPSTLSATGAFSDVRTLAPAPSLIPYTVNAPSWSDGAFKARWVALPPGGEKVRFEAAGEWGFPEGTVFVKHFELVDEARPDARRRVETRLLIRGPAGMVHGVGYKWRADQSDADLVADGRTLPLATAGEPRNWHYPGPADCRQCHNAASGGVLGVNTRQLNREMTGLGRGSENQLLAWGRLGMFQAPVKAGDVPRLARLAGIDDSARGLEDRARSYLDANCASCHRPGGAATDLDARYDTPLPSQGLVGAPSRINLGVDGARLIAPNDPSRSTVLARLETLEPVKMPPLTHEAIDRRAVELLHEWVGSLPGRPAVGPPVVTPSGGEYRRAVRVEIRHEDPATVIRYTLDGSAPGGSSPAYSGPFEVGRSTTVRARAYRFNHTRSVAAQETFVVVD